MGHGTKVSGANKLVTGGFTKVGGVNKKITKGLTRVDGAQKDIVFDTGEPVSLATFAEGDTLLLPEGNGFAPFYVAKHNYESGLNGSGRTLLLRQDCVTQAPWGNGANSYGVSAIDSYFTNTYKNELPSALQSLIGTTKIYATAGTSGKTLGSVETISRAIFALSRYEYGLTTNASQTNNEGSPLPIASELLVARYDGTESGHWTRTLRVTSSTKGAVAVQSDGSGVGAASRLNFGYRPAYTLPNTAQFNNSTLKIIL